MAPKKGKKEMQLIKTQHYRRAKRPMVCRLRRVSLDKVLGPLAPPPRVSEADVSNPLQVHEATYELILLAPTVTLETLVGSKRKAQALSMTEDFITRSRMQFEDKPVVENMVIPEQAKIERVAGLVFYHGKVYVKRDGPTSEVGEKNEATLRQVYTKGPLLAEQQVGQIIFFRFGELRLDILPTTGDVFYPDQGLFECGSDGEHSETCYVFAGNMIKYERKIRRDIIAVTHDWLTIFIATVGTDSSMVSRDHRLQKWTECLEPECIKIIFRSLAPGVNLDTVVKPPFWLTWAKEIIINLADDYVSKGEETYVDVLLHRRMREWGIGIV